MNRRRSRVNVTVAEAAMTFEEIGRELRITPQGAWMLYKKAMGKLRKKKVELRELVELARSKDVVS